jgi:hypothetical protein
MHKTYLHNIFGELKGQKADVSMGLSYAECIRQAHEVAVRNSQIEHQ